MAAAGSRSVSDIDVNALCDILKVMEDSIQRMKTWEEKDACKKRMSKIQMRINDAMKVQPAAGAAVCQPQQLKPCSYGASCSKWGCTYEHPKGFVPKPKAQTTCWYGDSCQNNVCGFFHAKRAGVTRKTKTLCWNGPNCPGLDKGCKYNHTDPTLIPCKNGRKCTQVGCRYRHPNTDY
jgi:hypothetical protein